jgi:hypothetical protein
MSTATASSTVSAAVAAAPRQFVAASARVPGAVHVLLLTTGSVASVKAPLIADALLEVRPPSLPTSWTLARAARTPSIADT